jgi:hypothetical protein
MGTFLIFLMSSTGHSDSMMHETWRLVQQIVQGMVLFLGLAAHVAQTSSSGTWIPSRLSLHKTAFHHAQAPALPVRPTVIADENTMILRSQPVIKRITCLFVGKATYHGQPSPNASVLVRVLSGDQTVTKGAITGADGSYSIQVALDAEDKAPIDWTMEAYTPDFQKVEINGSRIVQDSDEQENKPIVLTTPVEFVVSLSK